MTTKIEDRFCKVTRALLSHLASGRLHAFRPCMHHNQGMDNLNVYLKDCSYTKVWVSPFFAIFRDNHSKPKIGKFAGFSIGPAERMLRSSGYLKNSISLEHLIKRLARTQTGDIFGEYKEQILSIAKEQQFVWHLPVREIAG